MAAFGNVIGCESLKQELMEIVDTIGPVLVAVRYNRRHEASKI